MGPPFAGRAAAGIASDRRSYPQTALTFNLCHSRSHHDNPTVTFNVQTVWCSWM
jgi:hypothetical protein